VKGPAALSKAIEVGNSGSIAEEELNAAYVKHDEDPLGQKDSLFVALSAFVRTAKRVSQIRRRFNNKPEIFMDIEDIFSDFTLDLMHRIESGQYTHEGKMQKWIGYIWGNFFFPEIQTEIFGYLDRTKYLNLSDRYLDDDEDDSDVEIQNHATAIKKVEKEQTGREREGYAVPISRDHIFRQLSKPVQDIVQMLCEGMTQDVVAVNLGISTRQLRRRALEDDSNVVCIDACADYGEYLGDISACAAPSENSIADMVEKFETAITVQQLATILQCSRGQIYKLVDEGRLPALKVGTLVRLYPAQIADWIRSKMTIAA
jgi:excisionase family DNA binding protein